jgi:translation initiation factor IF-2
MSSTESSGATPAEATATPPAGATVAAPTFGTSRGSGLARGKRPTTSGPTPGTAASTEYTPTAIEIVSAPREYQNPFAPASTEPVVSAETPAAATSEPPAPAAPAPVAPIATPAPRELFPLEESSAPSGAGKPAELNILPPEQPKAAPAQTWESEGFRPGREPRADRPRREQSEPSEPAGEVDIASIPPQFLYVRPGVKFVPTPRNWGGAPRERGPAKTETAPAIAKAAPSAPAKSSGGIVGWLKGLFGGAPEARSTEVPHGEFHSDRDGRGGHRRSRGGRSHGESSHPPGGERGGHRRRRGGRGRGAGGHRGDQAGSSAT